MVYPETIVGRFVDLRSITLDDAEFSHAIRTDKRNRDTVGQLASSIQDQILYIKKQMDLPGDYYFVVTNKKGKKIGLTGVYDIHDDVGEIGREVNVGEPTEIMESNLLLRDFCKNVLKLSKVSFVIYANNIHHINDVMRRGAKLIGRGLRSGREALFFERNLLEPNAMEQKVERILKRLSPEG